MNQNYFGRLLCAGALLFSGSIMAQQSVEKQQAALKRIQADKHVNEVQFSAERTTPAFISFNRNNLLPQYQVVNQLSQYLQLRVGFDEMRNSRTNNLYNGVSVQEYKQFFKGIPVELGTFKALLQHENALLLTGAFYDIPANLNTKPAITEQQAFQLT